MPRSGEEVRRRLQIAALDLFRKQGYDATTAAEIAAAAGVTERTFFRHFPDKREALFDGEVTLGAALAQAVSDVPPEITAPLAVLRQAFSGVEPVLEKNRPFARPRAELIAATPALRERDLAKIASLQLAAAEGLAARGIPERTAALAAQVGIAAFGQAIHDCMPDPGADFQAVLTRAFDDLAGLGL